MNDISKLIVDISSGYNIKHTDLYMEYTFIYNLVYEKLGFMPLLDRFNKSNEFAYHHLKEKYVPKLRDDNHEPEDCK